MGYATRLDFGGEWYQDADMGIMFKQNFHHCETGIILLIFLITPAQQLSTNSYEIFKEVGCLTSNKQFNFGGIWMMVQIQEFFYEILLARGKGY